ncbi:hypothetical protein IV417_16460 [Alphaproteobacteria bacterium KMM 3653]|uniref:Uncharacterized protein n=1 Tax=Harenicola maris TaxID=2841044 RepID=A0AAP2CSZ1_9RHOB|nr:hypothetical protein [Harenicola maris]
MKRLLQWFLSMGAGFILIIIATFMGRRGDYPVSRLMTEDPSQTLAGVRPQLEVIDLVPVNEAPIVVGLSRGATQARAYLGQNPDSLRAAKPIKAGYQDLNGHAVRQTGCQRFMSGATYCREAILTEFRAQHLDGPDTVLTAIREFLN